jgi:carboxyl-terminal processing protease
MPRRNLYWLLGIGLGSLICWTLAQGSIVPPRGPLHLFKGFPGYQQNYERLSLLVDVLQNVELNYVHELSDEERQKFMENAIQAGLQSLDIHSAYINPKDFKAFSRQSEGVFGGVGIQIVVDRDSRRIVVISPIVGTPAYKAGIKPGDEIEKIDGEPTQGMSAEDAVERIQGPPGTTVRLTIRPRGSTRTVEKTLVRSIIEVESVLGDQRDANKNWDFMLDKQNRIAYVRLSQFTKKSFDELRNVLARLENEQVRGLILDLRNNPGGLLDSAVNIADLFLTSGVVVSVEGRNRTHSTYEAREPGTMLQGKPIVVLIDGSSASASEIVAAALQDHKRAVVMGERSFGKGSVQTLIPMEGGKAALKLTTAKYMRPSGKNIHRFPESKDEDDWGVRPDIEIPLTRTEREEYWLARRDRDIVRDELKPEELREPLARVASSVASAWQCDPPWGPALAGVHLGAASESLPWPPLPFQDKVRDRAVEYLREQLGKPATVRKAR